MAIFSGRFHQFLPECNPICTNFGVELRWSNERH
jgi:hypothetical protein